MIVERCCARCRYRPSNVRKARNLVALILASGEDPSEAIGSYLAPRCGPELGDLPGFGPRAAGEWAAFLADLERAARAVGTDPEKMAQFLCEYALLDSADQKELGILQCDKAPASVQPDPGQTPKE